MLFFTREIILFSGEIILFSGEMILFTGEILCFRGTQGNTGVHRGTRDISGYMGILTGKEGSTGFLRRNNTFPEK